MCFGDFSALPVLFHEELRRTGERWANHPFQRLGYIRHPQFIALDTMHLCDLGITRDIGLLLLADTVYESLTEVEYMH